MSGNASSTLILLCGIVVLGSLVVSSAVSLALHAHLLKRLRSNHHVLWLDLGAPSLWDVTLYGAIPFGGISARSAYPMSPCKYFNWLALGSDSELQDDDVASTGARLRRLFWLAVTPTLLGGVGLVLTIYANRV